MNLVQIVTQTLQQVINTYTTALRILQTLILSGWYSVVADAATVTGDIHALLDDPTCGQAAQCSKLDTLLSDVATLASDIAALGNPQQSGAPVTLPTTPPAAYIAPTTTANASAVWSAQSTDENTAYGLIMSILSVYLRVMTDSGAIPSRLGPGFSFNVGLENFINNPLTSFVNASIADIQPTDASLLDFLQREIGSVTWHQTGLGTYWADVGGGNALIQCDLSEGEFEWLRMLAGGPPAPGSPVVAPVWPGLAAVTLGSSHAISAPGEAIATSCDGVLVEITGVPSWAGKFEFGTATSWRNIGAISFTSDNGQEEFPQTWGFEDVVYLPKSMNHAAGYVYRAAIGVTGTVTPFTIN